MLAIAPTCRERSSSAFQLNVHNNVPVMPAKARARGSYERQPKAGWGRRRPCLAPRGWKAGIQKQIKKPGFPLALE